MKINIGIFFGGKSVEHEVSVISAAQAAAALDRSKYEVIPIYISKDNEMYTGQNLLTPSYYKDLPSLLEQSQQVTLVREKGRVRLLRHPAKLFASPYIGELDLAFPVIHGTNGEDGSIQGFFQLHGLPYVGSDVIASASAMDKWVAKCLLQNAGLPVLPGFCFSAASYYENPDRTIDRLESFHAYPLIIKPVNLGSSIGVNPAHNREALKYGIELAASFTERILAEPMLTGFREINCAVIGDREHTESSVCEEPFVPGEILDYADKYQGSYRVAGKSAGAPPAKGMESAKRKIPADLDADTEKRIRRLAENAFLSLNCSGVVRVDFLLDQQSGNIYINELNTIPGSLAFYLWEASGKPFAQLTEELIQLALKRNRMQNRLIWSSEV
ncbi:MAG: D-alanine--D-alanine ligase, partial [Clostridiales bacterium]|nr:D-alanine--D-alanine ligase [Clostridiales bacterium]